MQAVPPARFAETRKGRQAAGRSRVGVGRAECGVEWPGTSRSHPRKASTVPRPTSVGRRDPVATAAGHNETGPCRSRTAPWIWVRGRDGGCCVTASHILISGQTGVRCKAAAIGREWHWGRGLAAEKSPDRATKTGLFSESSEVISKLEGFLSKMLPAFALSKASARIRAS
jgi:hypothetical protein